MALTLTLEADAPASADAVDLAGPPQRFHAVVERHFDAVVGFLARRVGPDPWLEMTREEGVVDGTDALPQ